MANQIVSNKNRRYEIVKKLGEGGFGAVFEVKCVDDGKNYAFKFFTPSDKLDMQKAQRNIKRNIDSLVDKPLKYSDGKIVESLVRPLEMINSIPGKEGFGYIMELRDTSQCGTIFKSWKKYEIYKPDAKQTCEICIKIAKVFDRIHASGRGYKDVNEGNIYFDLQNNQVYIMDCDNIAADNIDTILGTVYYLAPEVFVTGIPNAVSDRYSMAVYFYRLMVGGYPLEGKKTIRYIMDNGLDDARVEDVKKVYDQTTLFAFDENDKSNSIVNVTDSKIPDALKNQWAVQAEFWNMLPAPIKAMFQKVFGENLKGTAIDRRPTESQWIRAFEEVLKSGIVKCKCGKHNYVGNGTCLFCGKKLPDPPPVVAPPPPKAVKYKVLSGKNSGKEFYTDKLKGADVLPSVFTGSEIVLESVLYSQNRQMMKIRNTSGSSIKVSYPGNDTVSVVNGGSVFLTLKTEIEISISGKGSVKLRVDAFKA